MSDAPVLTITISHETLKTAVQAALLEQGVLPKMFAAAVAQAGDMATPLVMRLQQAFLEVSDDLMTDPAFMDELRAIARNALIDQARALGKVKAKGG